MRAFTAFVACAALISACSTETKSTRVVIKVHSDVEVQLASVRVEISDKEGTKHSRPELFQVPKNRPNTFLLSFSVAPSAGGDDSTFVITVTGIDEEETDRVQRRQLVSFVPKTHQYITVWLHQSCVDVVCSDANTTCSDMVGLNGDGRCVSIGPEEETDGEATTGQLDAAIKPSSAGDAQVGPEMVGDGKAADSSTLSSTCDHEGDLRCTMPGTPLRQRCREGRWLDDEPCAATEVCDPSATDGGVCRAPLPLCLGSAGQPVCDGALMLHCNFAGSAESTEGCSSDRHCQAGIKSGKCAMCVPGDFRCMGVSLEICAEDGQSYTNHMQCPSASPCNAETGMCTDAACVEGSKTCAGDVLQICDVEQNRFVDEMMCDPGMCDKVGQQCDTCTPGARSCEGNSVVTCDADGLGTTPTNCTGSKPRCTGNGVCVQCVVSDDCPAPTGECRTSTCDTASGTCGSTPKAPHTACSGGVCDGSGNCVGCVNDSDCGGRICQGGQCVAAPRCGDGVVNQADEECDDGNQLNSDGCVAGCKTARCGDGFVRSGVEECEPSVSPANAWICSDACRKKTIYNPCRSDSDCLGNEVCFLYVCSQECPTQNSSTGCPLSPGTAVVTCGFGSPGLCIASRCSNNQDCAPGAVCYTTASPTYCTGCRSDQDCSGGKRCTLVSGQSVGVCE